MDKKELMRFEEERYEEMHRLVDSLTPEQCEEPGMNQDGWSVRDLVCHMGSWAAEAARELERIRLGTYEERDWGENDEVTDSMNEEFLRRGRAVDFQTAMTGWKSSRNMVLKALDDLPEVDADAEEWFGESGHEHYDDHLPELRAWAAKLTSGKG